MAFNPGDNIWPQGSDGRHGRPIDSRTDSRTDSRIVAAVLAGERARFGELVERHGGPVWSVITRSLKHGDDAREVFQETWLRALERLDTLREPERLRSWLLSIAMNQCRSRYRRGTEQLAPELEQELVSTDAGPDAALERGDEVAKLHSAIARLPERQRQVIELRLSAGLGHREIAAALGIREDNARANLYQAMRRLKAELGENNDPDGQGETL
jgi:RNA polymerase sigma-70 factor (ECF subfamily)